jgi:hypothetical protein
MLEIWVLDGGGEYEDVQPLRRGGIRYERGSILACFSLARDMNDRYFMYA